MTRRARRVPTRCSSGNGTAELRLIRPVIAPPVLLRGVALGAGALAVLAACPLRAAAGRAAVDGGVAALVALLRLRTIVLERRLAGIPAVSPRRVELLVFVMVPRRHRVPPIQLPLPARSHLGSQDRHARCVPLARLPALPTPLPSTPTSRSRVQTHPARLRVSQRPEWW